MEQLLDKYARKLISAGLGALTSRCRPLIGGMDDQLIWNREAPEIPVLTEVFKGLNINSLVFLRPAEPYASLIRHLAEDALRSERLIKPKDCETRTFLHDLPVIDDFLAGHMIQALKKRKSVIILPGRTNSTFDGPAIVAPGTVSPEQGFVTTSSVCFACFVKFFTDYLDALKTGCARNRDHALFDRIIPFVAPLRKTVPDLMPFPFQTEEAVYAAVIEAGQNTIACELVDSYFGNVSYCWNNTLYISQTGSSLDELAGCIDPVPMDGSSSAGITASSELSAHMETISKTGCRAILHGHPKFCVILSMDCDPAHRAVCRFNDQCHTRCPAKRFVRDIPIVPGEVGTGATGLCNTLPRALAQKGQAIVYGHGVFTTGRQDFSDAFAALLAVENLCRTLYFETVTRLRNPG